MRGRIHQPVGTGVLDGPPPPKHKRTVEDAGPYKNYIGTNTGDSTVAPTVCAPSFLSVKTSHSAALTGAGSGGSSRAPTPTGNVHPRFFPPKIPALPP